PRGVARGPGSGHPDGHRLDDLGHDLAGPQPRRLDIGDRVLGNLALLIARVEDLRAVAGADVVALAILGRRVTDLEEELQDVPVGDALRIEDDLDRLGVAGVVAVGRVVVLSTGVADPGGDHAVAVAQQLLDAPEAPSREDCGLGVITHFIFHGTAPCNGSRDAVVKIRLPTYQRGGTRDRKTACARAN